MKKIGLISFFILIFSSLFAINIDSLFNVAQQSKDFDTKARIYMMLVDSSYLTDPEYSVFLDSLVRFAKFASDDSLKLTALINKASYLNYIGEFDSARNILAQSLPLAKKLKDTTHLAMIWGEKGNSYCFQGDYKNCLDCFLKALEYIQKLNDPKFLGLTYNNIGNVYYYLDNLEKGLEYYKKALKIFSDDQYTYGVVLASNNIGSILYQQKDFDSAYYYYNISYQKSKENSYIDQLAEVTANLSQLFYSQNNLTKAEQYAKEAIEYTKKASTSYNLAKTYWSYADILFKMKKYKTARLYADSALTTAKNGDFLEFQKSAYLTLFKIDSATENYKLAIDDYLNYSKIKDSIINENTKKQIADLQSTFELKQKEKENELLKEKQKIQDIQLKRQRLINWFVILVLVLIIVITVILYKNMRLQKKHAHELEQKNLEINQQKEEIQTQNDVLIEQNKQIEAQRKELQIIYKKITDSIQYAKRIQNANLPDWNLLNGIFSDSFILYLPKDVVSGDFYFYRKLSEERHIIIIGDCTGHGVPGAFMSIMNMAILREILREKPDLNAAQILEKARQYIKEAMKQKSNARHIKDSMDAAVVIYNQKQMTINYAGANRPLYLFRDKELRIYTPDKQPVGAFVKEKPFTNTTFEVQQSDVFYMFTDGYYDQLSEDLNKKFYLKNFKKLLQEIHFLPMQKQKEILIERHNEFRKNARVTDDITIIGFKI